MEPHDVLTITSVDHPDPHVRRAGFDLDAPYVEHVWGPVIGPTATLLLRRLPVLWADREPARMTRGELSSSLGLGMGAGDNSRLHRAVDRLIRFRLATGPDDMSLDVFHRIPQVDSHQLGRLPDWTQREHALLLDDHIHSLENQDSLGPRVAAMTARLDRLERPRSTPQQAPARSPR